MTEGQVAKLVAVLIAGYPSARITAETSAVYERMLRDLDYAAVNAAVEWLLATSKWLPTVAEIREAAHSLRDGEVKPGGEAWGLVITAVRLHGRYRTPGVDFEFGDPVVAQCVAAMARFEICESENSTADRARFIELYDRLAAQRRRAQLAEGLPAVQQFRALQTQPSERLASGDAKPLGKLLRIVASRAGDA